MVEAVLKRLPGLLVALQKSIQNNLWQFVEALALHVAGGRIALSRYAGNILGKGLAGVERVRLLSVLCAGVVEGAPSVRRCLLDMVLKVTPEVLDQELGVRAVKKYVMPLVARLVGRGWEELRRETRDLVLLLERGLGREMLKQVAGPGRWSAGVEELLQ